MREGKTGSSVRGYIFGCLFKMLQIPIYYINLKSAPARRESIERQLTLLGLSGVRVEATTPAQLPAEAVQRFCNSAAYRWLMPTELACTFSHLAVWKRIIDNGNESALVIEDDVVLSRRLPAFLEAFDRRLPLVKVEASFDRLRAERLSTATSAGVEMKRVYGFSPGSAAYLISRQTAVRLSVETDAWANSIDRVLFDWFGETAPRYGYLQTVPALAVQADQLGHPPLGMEASAIKPDMTARFSRHSSRKFAGVRRWVENEIIIGSRKTYLDLTGRRKIEAAFSA